MRLAEDGTQAIFIMRHYNQVHMIRHQTVRPDLRPTTRNGFRQQFNIVTIIVVMEKRLLPTIAALCDMMRITRNNHPRYSGHLCTSLCNYGL